MPNLIRQLVGDAIVETSSPTVYFPAWDPATIGQEADGLLLLTSDGVRSRTAMPVSIVIETPTSSEKVVLVYTKVALTITRIESVLFGSATPSVTFSIRYGTNVSGSGTEVKTSGIVTTSVTTGDATTTFNNATVPANNFMWLTTSAQSGTVTALHVSVCF